MSVSSDRARYLRPQPSCLDSPTVHLDMTVRNGEMKRWSTWGEEDGMDRIPVKPGDQTYSSGAREV